ncbi:MAG: hypothetical protein IJ725_02895 [Ruminococcus sp.]|nr:hypothetical protein [Ruminococcus sp.]
MKKKRKPYVPTSPPDNRIILNSEQRTALEQSRNPEFTPEELSEGLTPEEEQRQAYLENIYRNPPINSNSVREAAKRLDKYKADTSALRDRLIRNENYWKLKQWKYYGERSGLKTTDEGVATAWLWNCIVSKLSDLMDGYPEANIRPKRKDDIVEAEKLKSIIPVICEANNYEREYSSVGLYFIKQGTGLFSVTWDGTKHDGLGDIAIEKVDILELFWEPGVSDIQDSREVFYTKLCDNDKLIAQYPHLKDKLTGRKASVKEYETDDTISKDNKSTVVDWYYKKEDENGNVTLHFCKYVDDEVLFATENDPENYPNGWYDHGLYPFCIEPLFEVENELTGIGYIDIGKGDQHAIDVLTSAILSNAKVAAKPRYFIKHRDRGINKEQFNNPDETLVEVVGNFDEENIRQINPPVLPSYVIESRNHFVEELKETLGNRDVNNGGTTSGITAASAIAAMQEQAGKLSREHNKRMYNLHKKVINMVIELIRQFYDIPREFRITGKMGEDRFIEYSNAGLQPQPQPSVFGVEVGLRLPCFDIEVSAQKSSPYSKMEQNELAIQLYNLGVFAPQNADMSMALLKTMDFSHKDEIMQLVAENGTMLNKYQALQKTAFQLAQLVDTQNGTNYSEGLAQAILAENGQNPLPQGEPDNEESLPEIDSNGGFKPEEHPYVARARQQAQEATQVKE